MLTVQFDRYGGGFVVELAKCPPDGVTTLWGARIPPNKVKAHNVLTRLRLGSNPAANEFDHWFRYDGSESPEEVAKSVVALIATQADAAWAGVVNPGNTSPLKGRSSPIANRPWWRFWLLWRSDKC